MSIASGSLGGRRRADARHALVTDTSRPMRRSRLIDADFSEGAACRAGDRGMSVFDRSRRNGAHCGGYEPLKIINDAGRSCILEALPNVILDRRPRRRHRGRQRRRGGLLRTRQASAHRAVHSIGCCRSDRRSLALIEQVRERGATINEYKVDLGRPGQEADRRVDVHCAPLPDSDGARACHAAGADNCRQNRQATDASRRRSLGFRAGLHAGA